jgi:hypothetical protein
MVVAILQRLIDVIYVTKALSTAGHYITTKGGTRVLNHMNVKSVDDILFLVAH